MESSGMWLLRTWFLPLVLAAALGTACAEEAPQPSQLVGGGCDGCKLMFEGDAAGARLAEGNLGLEYSAGTSFRHFF